MLRNLSLFIIIFLTLLVVVNHSQSELIDYLVAVVNGEPITNSMLEDVMNAFWLDPNELPKSPEDALNYAIDHKIKLQEARKLGIFVPEEEITNEITRITSKFSSKDELIRTLKKHGMSLEDLQENLEEELMIQKMVERKFGQFIRESELEGEATDYFEQNKTKFIILESVQIEKLLFRLDTNSDESIKQKVKSDAEEALKELRKGVSFSKYPNSLKTGYINVEQINPSELAEPIAQMGVGDISDVIETSEGDYIVKLNDRRLSRQATFSEVKDQIQSQIRQQKIKADLEIELKKQREIAEIKISHPMKK
jgi:parvulin-like peptidyl-prolyl isomerase